MLTEHKHQSFTMFAIYADIANRLPAKERLMLYDAIFDFAFNEVEPNFSDVDQKYKFSMESTFEQTQASVVTSVKNHDRSKKGVDAKEQKKRGGQERNQNARKHFSEVKTNNEETIEPIEENRNRNEYSLLSVSEEGDLPSPPPPRTKSEERHITQFERYMEDVVKEKDPQKYNAWKKERDARLNSEEIIPAAAEQIRKADGESVD